MNRERKFWRIFRRIFNSDLYEEQTAKFSTNVCFAVLVVTVLTFTVIAVTYKPPDPWFQSSKSFLDIWTKPQNAAFVPDDSVIVTAEDTPLLAPVNLPQAVNEFMVDEQEVALEHSNSVDCENNGIVNCSASGVLVAIEKYNLQQFRSLDFYSYRTPVRGSLPDECDVAWKYRPNSDGSPRLFRDFRRYSLTLLDTCDFRVDKVGLWHSGLNARPGMLNPSLFPGTAAPASTDLRGDVGIDTFDDGVINISESSFQQGRYLYYQRGGDYCKSMNQYMWSLLCAMGEAKYLNRTFVMDLEFCLPSASNPGHADEPGKDFRFYYDYAHLKKSLSLIDQKQFLRDWEAWDSTHQTQKIVARQVHYNTSSMELREDTSTVLKRVFNDPEPNNYWFRVCEGETEMKFQRPWSAIWKSRRINDIVLAICGRLGWEYDAVHVVRGEKVNDKARWPNLDSDTSPDALIGKLDKTLGEGRNVYIATNEQYDHYFDKLRSKWRIFQLDDFNDLWANTSEWYKEAKELNGGNPVEFDGYMRVEVDSEVFFKARNRIETFNDLTTDCRNGIEACS